jgi:RHS repeat-associated protein
VTYDSHALPTTITWPNGVSSTYAWPSVHTPSRIGYSGGASGYLVQNYGFDSLGLVEARMDNQADSGVAYRYDEVGRLKSARHFIAQEGACHHRNEGLDCPQIYRTYLTSAGYSYDKLGNRTDNGAVIAAGNRLTRFGTDSLVHDADGNLVRRIRGGSDAQRLHWNSLGQLVAVWTSGGDSVSFAYDALGRRARKWTAGATRQYIWDGENLLVELDGAGARVTEYTYYPGVDRPHSIRRGGAMYHVATDHPGNVTGLMDASGGLAKRYVYEPWGTIESELGTVASSQRFGAREYDAETGFYYVRARYYDPVLGRFLSEDPIGLDGGINPYAYAANNPVNMTDPSGLCPRTIRAADAALRGRSHREGGTSG